MQQGKVAPTGHNGLNPESPCNAHIGFKTSTIVMTRFGLNNCVKILHKEHLEGKIYILASLLRKNIFQFLQRIMLKEKYSQKLVSTSSIFPQFNHSFIAKYETRSTSKALPPIPQPYSIAILHAHRPFLLSETKSVIILIGSLKNNLKNLFPVTYLLSKTSLLQSVSKGILSTLQIISSTCQRNNNPTNQTGS